MLRCSSSDLLIMMQISPYLTWPTILTVIVLFRKRLHNLVDHHSFSNFFFFTKPNKDFLLSVIMLLFHVFLLSCFFLKWTVSLDPASTDRVQTPARWPLAPTSKALVGSFITLHSLQRFIYFLCESICHQPQTEGFMWCSPFSFMSHSRFGKEKLYL